MDRERKTDYANTRQNKVEVAISLSDRADFGQWEQPGIKRGEDSGQLCRKQQQHWTGARQ